MHIFSRFFRSATLLAVPGALALSLIGAAHQAHAQTTQTVFSNNTTYNGYFTPGGATTGNLSTYMDANLINLATGATGSISQFTASLVNANSVAVTATPIFSFYAVGTNGDPGTLITNVTFASNSFNSLSIYTLTATVALTLPTSFWVGETFTSSTATATQLNSFGEAIYGPPTVGTGGTTFFQGSTAGAYNVSTPSGGNYIFTGGQSPNFEYSFTGASTAPEPPAVILALSGGLLTVGGFVRRRRKSTN